MQRRDLICKVFYTIMFNSNITINLLQKISMYVRSCAVSLYSCPNIIRSPPSPQFSELPCGESATRYVLCPSPINTYSESINTVYDQFTLNLYINTEILVLIFNYNWHTTVTFLSNKHS